MQPIAVHWNDQHYRTLVWNFPTIYNAANFMTAGLRSTRLLRTSPATDIEVVLDMRGAQAQDRDSLLPVLHTMMRQLPPKVRRVTIVAPCACMINLFQQLHDESARIRITSEAAA